MTQKKDKKKTSQKADSKAGHKAEEKAENKGELHQHKEVHEKKHTPRKQKPVSVSHVLWVAIWTSVAVLYLSANIAASQIVHPLYGRLINDETDAWVTFFKVTRNEPAIQNYLQDNQGKYRDLQDEINKDNSTRLDTILKLEGYLSFNPQAKDVLFAIATLYKETGDMEKSNEYLRRAQAIDPAVSL